MPPKPPTLDPARLARIRNLLLAATASAGTSVACDALRSPEPPTINRPAVVHETINTPPTQTPLPHPPPVNLEPPAMGTADVPGPTPNTPATPPHLVAPQPVPLPTVRAINPPGNG